MAVPDVPKGIWNDEYAGPDPDNYRDYRDTSGFIYSSTCGALTCRTARLLNFLTPNDIIFGLEARTS